jgi:dolichyl-phosphate beta-glucosyltransferase
MMHSQDSSRSFECTLVLPTYKAAEFIESTVSRLRRFLGEHPDWCVLFVCDGHPDDTAKKLRALVADLGNQVQIDAYETNRGKGYALRHGLSMAKTPYRVFTDVDLAYDPDEALKILRLLESGADLAVANRASPESLFWMSPRDFPTIYRRHLMSRTFNWWLRQMLPITILDTQAGLKGISARAWEVLGPKITTDGFFFDVELLAWAGAARMRIDQTPIFVKYIDPTTVRMVRDGWSMIRATLKLRQKMRTEVTAALIRQWREEISRQPVVEERPVASQPN